MSVMSIIDRLMGKAPVIDELLTDDERELRDYENSVYTSESGVTDATYAEFVIDDAYYIVRKGVVVTGTVTGGVLKVGDKVQICRGDTVILDTAIVGIERFGNECIKVAERAKAGLLLENDDSNIKKLIKRNDILKKA